MKSDQVRQQFLDFFASKEHAIVPSSPVVPHDDPTLMFTNAGMNQFKDVFLGAGSRSYVRAADTQKCIRAGGKHNDLDDVGQDTYHQTFFEMLGNWSFGNYFKREAIAWAWELMTEVWGIEKDRLHATYFEGDEAEGLEPDSEAANLWREVTDIKHDHIHPGNKKDNFWEMGDTGPCGPCSEIHIDLTPDKSGASLVNVGDANVIELWNLVFIQYNRGPDGKLSLLPAKHVDTGMGFERIAAVLNGKKSNYDTDVFTPIFESIRKRCGSGTYTGSLPGDDKSGKVSREQLMTDITYRVIADHLRCLTFAITDGAMPSNEGRGYVLRRILRRAVRYGRQYFDMHEPFMCDLVAPLVAQMGHVFPELKDGPDAQHPRDNVVHVVDVMRDEEASFLKTLDRGIKLFDEAAEQAVKHHHGRISGDDAFKMHDTYGFPVDLTELMAEERGLTIDFGEYERLMEEAREKARSTAQFKSGAIVDVDQFQPTHFEGYLQLECSSEVVGVLAQAGEEMRPVGLLNAGEEGIVLLNSTSFYAEKGGQVGDRGKIVAQDGSWEFVVETTNDHDGRYLHIGRCVTGEIKAGSAANCVVDSVLRNPTMNNHTSTHILNWSLREVLGTHVQQKGSLVDADKTRFDLSHPKPITADELARIEELTNQQIVANHTVYTQEVDQAKARKINTLRAVFGEKYPDRVRVVSIGAPIGDESDPAADTLLGNPDDPKWMNYSVEFCGGTHVAETAVAERFVLTSEEGVAKGIRRVVGITGKAARKAESQGQALMDRATKLASAPADQLSAGLNDLQRDVNEAVIPIRVTTTLRDKIAELQKVAKKHEKEQAGASAGDVMAKVQELFASAETIGGAVVVTGEVPSASADALRGAIDWVRQKSEASVVVLACHDGGKVTLVAGVSKDLVGKGVKAGDIIKETAPVVGGKGGGRPDLAQGGGSQPDKISDAMNHAHGWIAAKLNG